MTKINNNINMLMVNILFRRVNDSFEKSYIMSNWSGRFMKKRLFHEIFSGFKMCEKDVSTSGKGQLFVKKSISRSDTLLRYTFTKVYKIELQFRKFH